MSALGPIGRLGRWSATRARTVFIAWAIIAISLGILAPRVEHALSGAGWEDSGSQSVQARDLIQIGAYSAGNDVELDIAVQARPQIEALLQQDMHQKATLDESRRAVAALGRG